MRLALFILYWKDASTPRPHCQPEAAFYLEYLVEHVAGDAKELGRTMEGGALYLLSVTLPFREVVLLLSYPTRNNESVANGRPTSKRSSKTATSQLVCGGRVAIGL